MSRVVTSVDSLGISDTELILGFEFKIPEGWHLYWKNAREVGLPPKLNWILPEVWKTDGLVFPNPMKIGNQSENTFSYGYEDHVLFPVVLTTKSSQKNDLILEGAIDYLICNLQCIPESKSFKITIPATHQARGKISSSNQALDEVINSLPVQSEINAGKWINANELEIYLPESFGKIADIFIARSDWRTNRRPLKVLTQNLGEGRWKISGFDEKRLDEKQSVEWTAISSDQKLSWTGVIDSHLAEKAVPGSGNQSTAFWVALLFAFLGGLILNLMPCVLPVVILKTTSVLKLAETPVSLKSSLFLTILGILSSFMILATVTLTLKILGHSVGWGFQFQNPQFLGFLILVIFIFALNLFDLFNIELGTSTSTKLASTEGAFAEGMLATLLATPCSAPFLGTALTYALTESGITLLFLFFVMGLGLSTPYAILLFFPQTLRFLPKPGAWMMTLKRFLAYSLLVSGIWIFSIFQQVASASICILLLGLMVATFIFFREFRLRWAVVLTVLLFSSTALSVSWRKSDTQVLNHFSDIRTISQRIEQGERLFVVVTADWCLTCKFNEQTVIDTEWFKKLLEERNMQLVMIDWTKQDSDIANFLKQHERVGIPFSATTETGHVHVLPELLTRSIVEEALSKF